MSIDASLVSLVTRYPDYLSLVQQAGVTDDYFVDDWAKVWRYICRTKREHGEVPSPDVVTTRFDWVDMPRTRTRDLPVLLSDVKKRRQHRDFVQALLDAVESSGEPDNLSDVVSELQGKLNTLALSNGRQPLRDLFSEEVRNEMMAEMRSRRSGQRPGLPTGLKRFDLTTGGLQRKHFTVVMGRVGLGKSWMTLLMAANAVVSGATFILYPLEMTLFETATRLYTIFSQRCYGQDRVLRNIDLNNGRATPAKVRRLLSALEDRFAGQLYVADVGSLHDPYTLERIEAEVELYRPHGAWIDYLTLMKSPPGSDRQREDIAVGLLAKGCKGIAQRHDCVMGASVQVNRDALKVRSFIPRPEHISFGDTISHPADEIVSINRKGEYLYYGLVKHRHGPGFGRTRVRFFPDTGVISETDEQDEDDDE